MIKIIYGNLFDSSADILCHQCNCQGVMGSGVAAEVKKRYPEVFKVYRHEYETNGLELGKVVFAKNIHGQMIANLLAQDKFGYDGQQYTRYDKLQECLDSVKTVMKEQSLTTVAFPYMMSCCRGGGSWDIVYTMITETFKDFDVEIWRLTE